MNQNQTENPKTVQASRPYHGDVVDALKSGSILGMGLACFSDERPLKGCIGELDWWLNQPFTSAIKKGIITGEKDEVVYYPIKIFNKTLRFLIVGQGPTEDSGRIIKSPSQFLDTVQNWANENQLKDIAVKRDEIAMEGIFDLWIIR